MKKNTNIAGFTLYDFKTDCKATVIKTVWHQDKDRQTDGGTESPEADRSGGTESPEADRSGGSTESPERSLTYTAR